MIYIPTKTYDLKEGKYENILYSPSKSKPKIIKAKNITIWDNHTFYYFKRYYKEDKQEKAFNHYLWLMDFIKKNYQEGITLITPDVDWMEEKYALQVEKLWKKECSNYPQLYVPTSWRTDTSKLNIAGYALRKNIKYTEFHPHWNHCLAHVRSINCDLLTYDAIRELNIS